MASSHNVTHYIQRLNQLMCGIAGILKLNGHGTSFPIGHDLLRMATCLQHRGADSAGVAVFSPENEERTHLQVAMPLGTASPDTETVIDISAGRLAQVQLERGGFSASLLEAETFNGKTFNGRSNGHNELSDAAFIRDLEEHLAGGTISAMGRAMRVYKAVGAIEELAAQMEGLRGTHGIAHLRLATESRIDPAHAQPFWGRPYHDIAVTHNGHITNYLKLRRGFESRGFSFASHNDSEIIGVYLGDKMEAGLSFGEALEAAARELDGSFSFIAATAHGLGVARDPLATKPLLYAQTDDTLALASEPQALYRVLGSDIRIREIKPKETRAWELL
jgi:glutamine phosphoribosylpyrophosphate amidotransferase